MKKKSVTSLILLILMILTAGNSVAQDDILFRRHLITNGLTGFYYGTAADIIFELNGPAAAGVPIITAGASVLVPLLINTDKVIDYDALVLNGHGKTIGWAHGMALGTLIGGEKAWYGENNNSNNYKLTVGLGALSSIGLGILGNSLAKNNDWSEGRVELYRHYGWLMPYAGFFTMASFSDEPRVYGAGILLSGAGGYLIADRISKMNDYTRGDIRSTQVLTILNGGLGWGIFIDLVENQVLDEDKFSRSQFLVPVVGALSGTLLGHLWMKNTRLTPQQGMLTAYSALGGAVLGLGIALIIDSEKMTPYYLLPYAGGLGAFAYTVERLRKKNSTMTFLPDIGKNNFHFSVMPQNLFLNDKIQQKGYILNGRYTGLQPLFAASLNF